ncbi:hypothetical protein SARC_15704 [Sphaeroforma arctica JP610]|uniref:Uncharacterized protein n=1 Tax=Sphaeroforma arctica JP610 TaxID=667725 RepID=A0A0L0F4W7_9EUKA|nr:hypothetical protein SARC_15704 [Sphaeroforma arctica JP610]KNC71752.1 hypothetical protein SARC_15704 [Sphaeroforma arctica JP610]|eukprot:XP_014145654.1 hypothetical protein SARC_15704 [Sphaeroforma arctica JP610]
MRGSTIEKIDSTSPNTAGQQAASTQGDSIERPVANDFTRNDRLFAGYFGMTPAALTNDSTQRLMHYAPVPQLNSLDTKSGWKNPMFENPMRTHIPQSGVNTGRPVHWQRVTMYDGVKFPTAP